MALLPALVLRRAVAARAGLALRRVREDDVLDAGRREELARALARLFGPGYPQTLEIGNFLKINSTPPALNPSKFMNFKNYGH